MFLSEGIQKFMYPDSAGPLRADRHPAATFFADLDGVEIVRGTLVLLGLLTWVAAVPLLIDGGSDR